MDLQTRWWNDKSGTTTVHASIGSLLATFAQNQKSRMEEFHKWYRLYGNYNSRGLSAADYARPKAASSNRLTLNVVQSCVDTAVAKICKNRPKPTFLTQGGSYSQQKKAKLLDKFCQGVFYQTDAHRILAEAFRDATVFGTGCVKIMEQEGRIRLERVFPDELLVDDMEAMYGQPRQLHQRKLVSRDELLAAYPAFKNEIERAKKADEHTSVGGHDAQTDMVAVIESWHLPSGKVPEISEKDQEAIGSLDGEDPEDAAEFEKILMKGHDGRHTLSIENATLFHGSWRKKSFPFVFVYWIAPPRGFWGQGIPEQLVGIQYEINMILRQIQQCLPLAVPRAWVRSGSNVTAAHLTDEIGPVNKYTGASPPIITSTSVIAPELFAHVDRLERQAYNITGVSQLSAQAKKPAGLESGAALREMNDIESERFAMAFRAYEDLHMAVAKQIICLAKEIADRPKDGKPQGYPVTVAKKQYTVTIDWAEIGLSEDDYVMQIFPTSSLPQTPAGRLAMVQDLMNLGFLGKEDALRLLNFPDLESVNELAEASAEFTSMQIEAMLEDGRPQRPEPFQNLDYAKKTAQSAYLLGKTLDVPDSHLEELQNYMNACVEMLLSAQAGETPIGAMPAGPAGPPGPLPPGIMPGMPPGALPPGIPPGPGGAPAGVPLQ